MLHFLLAIVSFAALPIAAQPKQEVVQQEKTPPYLYKVLSLENWKQSQAAKSLALSADDQAFIHFSREDQLERITSKYWSSVPEYMILKISTAKLLGKLVLEANPGGTSKYYHLYDGSIPLDAITESKIVKN
jgi:uncharacterized protein (DUF952 family)